MMERVSRRDKRKITPKKIFYADIRPDDYETGIKEYET